MDPKRQDNYLKKYDEKNLDKIQSKTVFGEPAFNFITKKTEKIVAALNLVADTLSDTEPIKAKIKYNSLGLISDTLSLKRLSISDSKKSIDILFLKISEIISLLKIGLFTEQISTMNFSILNRELITLMENLHNYKEERSASINSLSEDLFNVSVPVPNNSNQNIPNSIPSPLYKGQYRTSIGQKDSVNSITSKDNAGNSIKDTKSERHETILKLLKDGKALGIKDFVREIKDCSEKTIQRELLAMVQAGSLKKTGERRWSLYSIA